MLVVAAAAAVTLLPDRVTVPTVQGAPDVATAERTLQAAGLQLDPRLRSRTSAGVAPGTIIDQIPGAGMRARAAIASRCSSRSARGAPVTPSLSGQTPARAAALLRAAGLTVGPLLPAGAPARAVVASQLPAAGTRVPAGTAVTLIVRAATRGRGGRRRAPSAPGGRAAVPSSTARP